MAGEYVSRQLAGAISLSVKWLTPSAFTPMLIRSHPYDSLKIT